MPVPPGKFLPTSARCIFVTATICAATYARTEPPAAVARAGAILTAEDDAFLDEVERTSFRYFVEQSHPFTGLVRDRARADASPTEGKASISAEGFAITAWAIAAQRGWVERPVALERVRTMLRFLATKAPRQHGFFYHFMEMDTGARAWQCELSSIDTGLFFAGAIVAREYFQDPEITALVNQLYGETDWSWFLNGGSTVAMGWHDEAGFSRFRWGHYSEHTMMSFLGMGAPEHALPESYWRAWKRDPVGSYAGYHFIQGPPLFIHQFAHAYLDFRDRRDAFADYYHNSVLATLAQRKFCMDLRSEFPTWSERLWGLTASDSANGYKAWGGPPRTGEFNALDGTIVPCATAGSLPFAPYETLMVLHHIRTVYGDRVWQRYGFVDAFNPETGWVNPDVIGIDLGISILQAENARTGFVWSMFMQAPEVQRALQRAGFVSKSHSFTATEAARLRALAAGAWKSLAGAPITPDTLGLQLTAIPAAHALGLIGSGAVNARVRDALAHTELPRTDVAIAEFAASLVTLRQAFHSLAPETSDALDAVKWESVTLSSTKLGSASRLAAFFKVATAQSKPAAWTQLVRTPEERGTVFVLSPASISDQLHPGLWLDESTTISGASAAQLAYTLAVNASPGTPPDASATALLIDQLPAEWLKHFGSSPTDAAWFDAAPVADRAALLISVANLLVPDCIREWFQQDPLVRAGRIAIQDFNEPAFGKDTSILTRFELAGPFVPPPERRAVAVSSTLPREQWPWTKIAGLEYKDSPADVRPDDPILELHFSFTWDHEALHFHAEAIDTPPNSARPEFRKELVELFVDPKADGYVWRSPDDFQFIFRSDGDAFELCHSRPAPATIRRNAQGFTVDADIPWSVLGLTPVRGLTFNVSAAVATDGRYEWEPSLKLSWRFFQQPDERFGLGTLTLE